MAKTINSIVALLALLSVSTSLADERVTVFVNVNVIPMSSEVVQASQSVVIKNGRIEEIGHVDSVPVPKGAVVIDGTDRYLMPGLAEMHAHVTSTEPEQFDRLATLFVANGITTIRGMLGRSSHLKLREQLERGEIFGPRLVTSGPSVNGRSVDGAADAARFVRQQKTDGFDFVKVHPGPSAAEFVAMARAAEEIGIPFAGHVPASVGVHDALQLGMITIDHLDGYFRALLPTADVDQGRLGGFFNVMLAEEVDIDEIPAIAAATVAAGTWNVPTQVLIEQMIDDSSAVAMRQRPEMRFVSRATVEAWIARKEAAQADRNFDPKTAALAIELRRRIILELHEAGAGLLLGSDAPQTFNVAGFSTHRELRVLVDSGLTPYEALRTGTAAVADFLGIETGVIAEGRIADLLLLDANPLQDIGNSDRIHGVMLRGKWMSATELEVRLSAYELSDALLN